MSNNSYYNEQWRIINEPNQNKISNYSMEFDGSNDFVTISDPIKFTGDFTISAWIYPTRVDDGYEMIYTQGTPIIQVAPYFAIKDTRLHVYIAGVIETELNFITPNKWQHVAVTRSSAEAVSQGYPATAGGITLFIDGVQSSLTVVQGGTFNTNSNGIIGKWNSNTHYFKGKIDQFCIFDYALPATGTNSVATLYGGGTAVTNPMALSPAPVAYYQLGDQTASNNTTEPTPPVQSYLVPNNSLQDYVFNIQPSQKINTTLTPPIGANNRTISVWFKTGVNAFENICGYGTFAAKQAFDIVTYTNGTVGVHGVNTQVEASGTFVLNEWTHYAVTYDGTILRGYLNGQPVNTSTIALNTGTSVDFTIGAGAYTSSNGFAGDVSNIAIWNSVLTAGNVSTIYNNGAPNDISSLSPTSWWKLNAQEDSLQSFNPSGPPETIWTIKDYAGSNDGTSNGMTSANLVQSNLQHTSGYSPYALSLDGTGQVFNLDSEILLSDNKSVSFWFKLRVVPTGQFVIPLSSSNNRYYPGIQNNVGNFTVWINGANGAANTNTLLPITADVWYNFIITGDGTTPLLYINGTQYSFGPYPDSTEVLIGDIGGRPNGTFDLDGDMSNVAIWSGTTLSSTEATEIYNSGVPSDLNTFSGTKPTAWWQLGSNSSFNSTTSQWTCIDEIGTNNAESLTNMSEDDITNGVGYSANGLGTSSIEIVGDAPYSTANSISNSMDVLSRSTDLPN